MNQRIGILGGSFDPPHLAHVRLAELFASRLHLSELRIIPVGLPWQKHGLHASRADRIAMLDLAFQDSAVPFVIDQRELDRDGPSYTVETLTQLRAELGESASLTFLMGADQLLGLPSWHGFPALLDLANFAAAGRPGNEIDADHWPKSLQQAARMRLVAPNQLSKPHGQVTLIPADLGEISSTRVRELLLKGDYLRLDDLLPSKVLEYIRARGLYLS
jgi:nicotinate-nucleotide adenylyltransferase